MSFRLFFFFSLSWSERTLTVSVIEWAISDFRSLDVAFFYLIQTIFCLIVCRFVQFWPVWQTWNTCPRIYPQVSLLAADLSRDTRQFLVFLFRVGKISNRNFAQTFKFFISKWTRNRSNMLPSHNTHVLNKTVEISRLCVGHVALICHRITDEQVFEFGLEPNSIILVAMS